MTDREAQVARLAERFFDSGLWFPVAVLLALLYSWWRHGWSLQ